jgi:outer membrane protein assembly factor BamA
MKLFPASVLSAALLLVPALAQSRPDVVPTSAVVETIEFRNVPPERQRLVLDHIGVRVGDTLNGEARQRIARELGKLNKGMTFTYTTGSAEGGAKLIISPDC